MHLSIVIPVFNSSNILNNLIKQIKFNLKFKEIKKFEIILVNDCSQDNSWNKIKELSKKNVEIKGINLSNNYGQHSSIFAGLKYLEHSRSIRNYLQSTQNPSRTFRNNHRFTQLGLVLEIH